MAISYADLLTPGASIGPTFQAMLARADMEPIDFVVSINKLILQSKAIEGLPDNFPMFSLKLAENWRKGIFKEDDEKFRALATQTFAIRLGTEFKIFFEVFTFANSGLAKAQNCLKEILSGKPIKPGHKYFAEFLGFYMEGKGHTVETLAATWKILPAEVKAYLAGDNVPLPRKLNKFLTNTNQPPSVSAAIKKLVELDLIRLSQPLEEKARAPEIQQPQAKAEPISPQSFQKEEKPVHVQPPKKEVKIVSNPQPQAAEKPGDSQQFFEGWKAFGRELRRLSKLKKLLPRQLAEQSGIHIALIREAGLGLRFPPEREVKIYAKILLDDERRQQEFIQLGASSKKLYQQAWWEASERVERNYNNVHSSLEWGRLVALLRTQTEPKLTHGGLAKKMGMEERTIWHIEGGRYFYTEETATKIANVLCKTEAQRVRFFEIRRLSIKVATAYERNYAKQKWLEAKTSGSCGQELGYARLMLGLSQPYVANKVGISLPLFTAREYGYGRIQKSNIAPWLETLKYNPEETSRFLKKHWCEIHSVWLKQREEAEASTEKGCFGKLMAAYRNILDLKQTELAVRLGVNSRTLANWEEGAKGASFPSLIILSKMIRVFKERYEECDAKLYMDARPDFRTLRDKMLIDQALSKKSPNKAVALARI